ncbi:PREDICTED: uncharacterized protein LOC109180220 [Ipomoea nil]|uniref:uncharacterized protein LOC109180220 n=1 Tax=Ipomoea nil TaxID=35883 RepID=UPI000901A565|nr:PREDICTED: uncharacterized protein LOC109180220 [Ipomoea nil]
MSEVTCREINDSRQSFQVETATNGPTLPNHHMSYISTKAFYSILFSSAPITLRRPISGDYYDDDDDERRRLGPAGEGEAEEDSFRRRDGYGSGERGVDGGDRVAALGGGEGAEIRRSVRSQPDSEDQSRGFPHRRGHRRDFQRSQRQGRLRRRPRRLHRRPHPPRLPSRRRPHHNHNLTCYLLQFFKVQGDYYSDDDDDDGMHAWRLDGRVLKLIKMNVLT